MNILFHRRFNKRYRLASVKLKAQFKRRLALFVKHPFHPLLNNHALRGAFLDYRSINITGDVRAVYKTIDANTVEFVLLGAHHELYGT